MTEKELRKLNRYQLLELLLAQTERAEQLEKQLSEAREQLNQNTIQLTNMGSIAEASLQLSGVFEAAQKAADLYIESAKKRAEEIELDARRLAASIVQEAEDTIYYKSFLTHNDTDR